MRERQLNKCGREGGAIAVLRTTISGGVKNWMCFSINPQRKDVLSKYREE